MRWLLILALSCSTVPPSPTFCFQRKHRLLPECYQMNPVTKWCYICKAKHVHTFKVVDGKLVQVCEQCKTETEEP